MGTVLIYNKNLKLIDRNDLKLNGSRELKLENIWLETQFPNNKKNYMLGIIYKHPGSSIEGFNDTTKQLETILKRINNENKLCIMTGDLNIDGHKINKNDHVKAFFNTALENDFIPTITLPTRIMHSSVSLIYHIFINSQVIKMIIIL